MSQLCPRQYSTAICAQGKHKSTALCRKDHCTYHSTIGEDCADRFTGGGDDNLCYCTLSSLGGKIRCHRVFVIVDKYITQSEGSGELEAGGSQNVYSVY